MSDDQPPSTEDICRLLDTLQTAVDATASSAKPLLSKIKAGDESLDLSDGLSLLLVRPHMLLASLHHLVVLVGLRLSTCSKHTPKAGTSAALSNPFADDKASVKPEKAEAWEDEIAGELALCTEVMDKVRGMETKLDYQIKKLVGLAEQAEKAKVDADDVEEDPLSFRPNPKAMVNEARAEAKKKTEEDDNADGVYRPPRVAAVPYKEEGRGRTERRAPALLSEFAQGLDGAPAIQTTSGLSTRPVLAGAHTNSYSAKRAEELKRIAEWEEDNMTRLVTTKREGKRRREDEEALALGFGVGGSGRGRARRQNGLEAELEGVLGDRGSKGVWDGANKLGARESMASRGKDIAATDRKSGPKKARFEKDIKRKRRAIGLPTK